MFLKFEFVFHLLYFWLYFRAGLIQCRQIQSKFSISKYFLEKLEKKYMLVKIFVE